MDNYAVIERRQAASLLQDLAEHYGKGDASEKLIKDWAIVFARHTNEVIRAAYIQTITTQSRKPTLADFLKICEAERVRLNKNNSFAEKAKKAETLSAAYGCKSDKDFLMYLQRNGTQKQLDSYLAARREYKDFIESGGTEKEYAKIILNKLKNLNLKKN